MNICFEIPDTHECDQVFNWMRDNPKDIWNFERRVQKGFHTQDFLLDASWSDDDILDTRLTRLQQHEDDSNIIQYEVTLRRYADDPKVLVDLIRRCKSAQGGSFGGWKIRAWYRREASPWHYRLDKWTADDGNDGVPYYNMYGGFNENVLHPALGRHPIDVKNFRHLEKAVVMLQLGDDEVDDHVKQPVRIEIASEDNLFDKICKLHPFTDWGVKVYAKRAVSKNKRGERVPGRFEIEYQRGWSEECVRQKFTRLKWWLLMHPSREVCYVIMMTPRN